jgi:N,N'-diacetyllegionaminate synthase
MSSAIFQSNQTFIIAEAGVNHNGDIQLAKALIDLAVRSGANAVKFQLFDPETLTSNATPLAAYQQQNASGTAPKSQRELLTELALPLEAFPDLQAYAEQQGILFLCSPFDEASAQYLHHQLKLPCLKIASGEITNLPFLEMLGELNTPLILSTGMSTLVEIQTAVQAVWKVNKVPLGLLHCVSAYPAPTEAVNLKAMATIQEAFPDCIIGYSDHTLGTHISIAAVALGARIIEKHFTLDKTLPGPDHKASLSVEELQTMVYAIREIEQALGDGVKQPQPCEQDCIQVARKSLVSRYDLPKGHRLTLADLVAKRPGTGISPVYLQELVGKQLNQPVKQDELITLEMIAPKYVEA